MNELIERTIIEVRYCLKLSEEQDDIIASYTRRAIARILSFCNRTDFPPMLEMVLVGIAGQGSRHISHGNVPIKLVKEVVQ